MTTQNPVEARRASTIDRLLEQKLLAADKNYVRVTQTWTRKDGQRVQVEKQQRVFPWWKIDQKGTCLFSIRYAGVPVEFEKGKNAVAASAFDRLPGLIDTLIAAVRAGELDDQLAQISKQRTPPKVAKKA